MPGNPLSDPNWAPNLADTIERLVTKVRDKTTKPLLIAYRGVVFGLVAVFGATFALVLAIIIGVRGIQALIDISASHEDSVWISYFVIGGLFSLVGLIIMKKRFPRTHEA
ncbi:MAG: hypothetical protein ABIW84_09060 [Ilumatobacteraceae bacterium]